VPPDFFSLSGKILFSLFSREGVGVRERTIVGARVIRGGAGLLLVIFADRAIDNLGYTT